jgi:uroporphyrinogen-III synthase
VRVWVTRAEPGAAATAERLRQRGHEPLVAPLLVVRPLADAPIDLTDVAALAFTSVNGVQAFARLQDRRDLPVYAVGEATAAAARAAGFSEVVASDGGVEALGRRIVEARKGKGGVVLHPTAAEPAGDLVGDLTGAGAPARAVAVYETLAVEPSPAPAADVEAVLIHSPRAARVLAASLDPGRAGTMDAYALSPACAEPLASIGFRRLAIPPTPRDEALLDLITPPSRRAGPGPVFWAALVFGLICVLAGAAFAAWAPALFPRDG